MADRPAPRLADSFVCFSSLSIPTTNLFYLNKVIIKFWSSKNFFVPPKLGAKSPPMSERFPSYLNCYIEPYLQTGSQVQNFCVDFKLLEQVYLSRPPTFCENAPFTMPVMVLWETCTLI